MASERAREREVHRYSVLLSLVPSALWLMFDCDRYYQSWLQSLQLKSPRDTINSVPTRKDGIDLKTSRDKTLVAFSQLGCLRLNAKRCLITLIASVQQYVLAEATKTTSLVSDYQHDDEDELWFSEGSLPRSQGVSEHALVPPQYTAHGPDGTSYTAPALIINDLAADERFMQRGYTGKGISFYSGLPITSKSGYVIGVYTVTDDQARGGLSIGELKFLQDMAITVADHLETIRNDAARYRGERMVQGLGSFIEGSSSIYGATRSGSLNASVDAFDRRSQQETNLGGFRGDWKGIAVSDTNPTAVLQTWSSQETNSLKQQPEVSKTADSYPTTPPKKADGAASTERTSSPDFGSPEQSSRSISIDLQNSVDEQDASAPADLKKIYARAANILRECTAADGVVFYDAVFTKIAQEPDTLTSDNAETSNTSASDDTHTESEDQAGRHRLSTPQTRTESPAFEPRTKRKTCQMLGFSFKVSSVARGNVSSIDHLTLTESDLRRFIRRFPKGKVFHYTTDGEISSTEGDNSGSGSGSDFRRRALPNALGEIRRTAKRTTRMVMSQELLKVVPGARNAVFLPLWDFTKQRWSAGAFVWSRRAEELLNVQDDLAYLKAFGNSIMSEVIRLDAIAADKAKTSFIANISHELRSPLHGILGSIEFLQGTAIDAFQSSMIVTVETCGKTLLDTVNHVLDYAKINHLSKSSSRRDKIETGISTFDSQITTTLNTDFDLAAVIEEVVEAIYAGQTFRSAGAFHDYHDHPGPTPQKATLQENGSLQESSPHQRTSTKFSGAVRLTLEIEKKTSWWVHSQPGAIRRVVMNLLGNSLKYTEKGFVEVALHPTQKDLEGSKSLRFCLSVTDSGKGMSLDFAHNHAFTAFTQEDSFYPGTGLGLSIIRQIVTSLGGKIELESEKGTGTQVKVWLSLPVARTPQSHDASDMLTAVAKETRDLTMCFLDPEFKESHPSQLKPDVDLRGRVENSIRTLAQNWFGMKLLKSATMTDVDADLFIYAEPPSIEYLLEHHESDPSRKTANERDASLIIMTLNAFETAALKAKGIHRISGIGQNVEVTSQP